MLSLLDGLYQPSRQYSQGDGHEKESVKKLGVSFFDYVHDRILGTNLIPRLDTLLTERAATMRLSPSWIKS